MTHKTISKPDLIGKAFNVRVYGLLFNIQNEVLLVEETINGLDILKFPGGGLLFGEGVVECIQREFLEETNLTVIRAQHYYTTEFFQQSAFNPNHQIISLYYKVVVKNIEAMSIPPNEHNIRKLRFAHPKDIDYTEMTFPIDRIVLEMLKSDAT